MMENPADIYDNYIEKCKQSIRNEVKKCTGENKKCQSKLFLSRNISLDSNLFLNLWYNIFLFSEKNILIRIFLWTENGFIII